MRFLFLFITTLLFCLTIAVNAELKLPQLSNFIFAVLLMASLLVIGEKEDKIFVALLVLLMLQLLQIFLSMWVTHVALELFKAIVAVVFFLLLTVACLRLTLCDKTISVTTLFGSLSGYLFIGLSFAYLYLALYAIFPQDFIGFKPFIEVHAIYYSFVTLTTLGIGDVVPTAPITQTLTWIEAFFGQAYMAIFISQLVGRYVAAKS